MQSDKPKMVDGLGSGLPMNTVGLHAPAWPGYPDPMKIPKGWMPIRRSKPVDAAFERLLESIEPVALDEEGKPVVGTFEWAEESNKEIVKYE